MDDNYSKGKKIKRHKKILFKSSHCKKYFDMKEGHSSKIHTQKYKIMIERYAYKIF